MRGVLLGLMLHGVHLDWPFAKCLWVGPLWCATGLTLHSVVATLTMHGVTLTLTLHGMTLGMTLVCTVHT